MGRQTIGQAGDCRYAGGFVAPAAARHRTGGASRAVGDDGTQSGRRVSGKSVGVQDTPGAVGGPART